MKLEDYLKLNLKKKIIIFLIIFFTIILSLIYLIVIPTITDIKKMGKEIEAQRLDLENKYIKGQSLKQLSENLKKIEPQLNKLDNIFINQNRELEFITTLEGRAQINNVGQKINLASAQVIEGNDVQNYKKIPLQLFTQGSFLNQVNYLLNLEALDYYINIKSIELYPISANPINNDTANLANIAMLISAETFWK